MSGYIMGALIGAAAGLHAATWGLYKDSPYEGLSWRKFLRSAVLGGSLGFITFWFFQDWDMSQPATMFVYFGLIYMLERGATEFWKVFLRVEEQSKYAIPMRFAVFGKPISHSVTRIAIGCVYGAVILAVLLGVQLLDKANLGWPTWLVVITIGCAGGWISAIGGAWKDAPIEGFEILKFFRSPAVALVYAAVIASFTDSYLVIALAALGFTIATIETHKTFSHPNKPPGKFAGKPIHYPEMLLKRCHMVPLYTLIWAGVIGAGLLAVYEPYLSLILYQHA